MTLAPDSTSRPFSLPRWPRHAGTTAATVIMPWAPPARRTGAGGALAVPSAAMPTMSGHAKQRADDQASGDGG